MNYKRILAAPMACILGLGLASKSAESVNAHAASVARDEICKEKDVDAGVAMAHALKAHEEARQQQKEPPNDHLTKAIDLLATAVYEMKRGDDKSACDTLKNAVVELNAAE